MRQALARLLLLLAVLLMPLGMAAPAAAASHPMPQASAMKHCPDNGAVPHETGGIAQCTMACAATLPAFAAASADRLSPVPAPSLRILAEPLTGLHPETATPPPRAS